MKGDTIRIYLFGQFAVRGGGFECESHIFTIGERVEVYGKVMGWRCSEFGASMPFVEVHFEDRKVTYIGCAFSMSEAPNPVHNGKGGGAG